MTDRSGWTDEQINEAILSIRRPDIAKEHYSIAIEILFDYVHLWSMCGELINEMGDAISDGWEFSCEHSDMDGLDPLKWRVWMTRFTNDEKYYRSCIGESDDFRRAAAEVYLEWKEQG